MRFTVSQTALSKALSIVSKGIASNSTLPMLAGICISAKNGTLELQTTNLSIFIKHSIPANVEEEGTTVISGKVISNIVKTLSDAAVTFDGDSSQLTITSEKSVFKLNVLDAADFPAFPEFQLERSVELPSQLLSTMVDKVYKVTSKDNARPVLAGIFMTVANNVIRLVATDSYRLAVCDTNVATSQADDGFEMIIPGQVFHDVLSIPSDVESILIGSTESQVVFVFGDTTYVSRRIEGNYPDYRRLMNGVSCETSVDLDVVQLSAALKRVSVVVSDNSNPSVRFDVSADGNLVKLYANSSDRGEASESLAAEVKGSDTAIALNYHYVFDCVNALSGEKNVTLELQDAMKPGIFKSYSKINYLYLLMPVRM